MLNITKGIREARNAMSDTNPLALMRDVYQNLSRLFQAKDDLRCLKKLNDIRLLIEREPGNIKAINQLAGLAYEVGKSRMAASLLRHALSINPGDAALHGNLGLLYQSMGEAEPALQAFHSAVECDASGEIYYASAANIYQQLGDDGRLLEWLNRALQHCPKSPALLVCYGEAIKRTGDIESAMSIFRRALSVAPYDAYILHTLANTKKFTQPDEDVAMLEKVLETGTFSNEDKGRLCIALGKVYEDLADYDCSFKYYQRGNNYITRSRPYNHQVMSGLVSDIIREFDPGLFEKFSGVGFPERTPVFILGMPRSGSTLLEQMMSCHPRIYGAGELGLIDNSVRSLWAQHAIPPGSRYPARPETIRPEMFSEAGKRYCDETRKLVGPEDVDRIIDKMPYNFLRLGVIRLMLPHARVIHIHRDPMDTCFSCFKQLFSGGNEHTFSLEGLGRYYLLYRKLMSHWQKVLPDYILDVQYEDLVHDPEVQLRRALAFCGLAWDEACLDFHRSKKTSHTASSVQIKQPLYKSAVGYWRHYEKHLGPLQEILRGESL